MRRRLLLGFIFLPVSFAHSEPLTQGFALTDGSGATAVTVVWFRFPPQPITRDPGGYMLRIDTRSGAVSVDTVGKAIDRLLDRSIRHQPLPAHFEVRFGAVREPLEAQLQDRLNQPHRGAPPLNLKQKLASIIEQSAIAAAFRHHGYILRLDEIARITQDTAKPRSPRSVSIHIDEMDLSAHKVSRR